MKKLLLFFFIPILLTNSITFSQSPVVQSVIDQTNIDSLIYFVRELSGDVSTITGGTPYTILSRNKYEPGNDKAADYIQLKLASYGLVVYNQTFGSSGRNVYGIQSGTLYPNQSYIICAHYDDMPFGSVAPGADDNASGTAAVIEAARIFSQFTSEYTIIYALWDEEEQGLIGSDHYAQLAQAAGDSILGVVNLDMIAWDSNSDYQADIHTRSVGTSIYLKDKIVETNSLYNLGLNFTIRNPGSNYSDHASFWFHNFGAILLIESDYDFNNYYHTTGDLVSHFNQPYYQKMSQVSYGTLATLAIVTRSIPVELIAFTGYAINRGVKLEWSTATELNNYGFEIERAFNDNNFATVGFVKGNGTATETNNYSFVDVMLVNGIRNIKYKLKQVDFDGTVSYSKVINVEYGLPSEFSLNQNYPNPFNPSTKIAYTLPADGIVNLTVYDIMGAAVATLANNQQAAGTYEINFDASHLPSGIYFYTLSSGEFTSTRKMMLVK